MNLSLYAQASLVLMFLAGCGGSAIGVDAPDDASTRTTADGAETTATSDSGATTTTQVVDSGATTPVGPDGPRPIADAGPTEPAEAGPIVTCAVCLQSSCAGALATCQSEAACASTVQCVIDDACFGPGFDEATLTACMTTCETDAGLTGAERLMVGTTILAMATCGAPCATKCAAHDGG